MANVFPRREMCYNLFDIEWVSRISRIRPSPYNLITIPNRVLGPRFSHDHICGRVFVFYFIYLLFQKWWPKINTNRLFILFDWTKTLMAALFKVMFNIRKHRLSIQLVRPIDDERRQVVNETRKSGAWFENLFYNNRSISSSALVFSWACVSRLPSFQKRSRPAKLNRRFFLGRSVICFIWNIWFESLKNNFQ